MVANRRLWLIICSCLMGEENKPFLCPSSSLPPLQRLPQPVWNYFSSYFLLLLEWERRWGKGGVVLGKSDSSFRQQDEEDGLEEVPKTANSSHEPVGAEGGVSIHHTFGDVCLMRREERSSERGAHTYQPFLQAVPAPQPMASHQSCCSTRCGL